MALAVDWAAAAATNSAQVPPAAPSPKTSTQRSMSGSAGG